MWAWTTLLIAEAKMASCSPKHFPFLPGHTSGLRFPASLAIRGSRVIRF